MFKKLLTGILAISLNLGCAQESLINQSARQEKQKIIRILEGPSSFVMDLVEFEFINGIQGKLVEYKKNQEKLEELVSNTVDRVRQANILETLGEVRNGRIYKLNPDCARESIEKLAGIYYGEVRKRFKMADTDLLGDGLVNKTLDCDTSSFPLLEVGKRLNLPLHEVILWGQLSAHEFLRWDDGKNVYNLETTGGKVLTNEESRKIYPNITEADMKLGRMFVNLTEKESLAIRYCTYAGHCCRHEKFEEAELWFNRAIKTADHPYIYHCKTMNQCSQNHEEKSLKLAEETIRKFPGYYFPQFTMGSLLHVYGKSQEALKHFDKAIKLCPEQLFVYDVAIVVSESMRDYNMAGEYTNLKSRAEEKFRQKAF